MKNIKNECLNCGYKFRDNQKLYKDKLGYHMICENCGSSSDITRKNKESSKWKKWQEKS